MLIVIFNQKLNNNMNRHIVINEMTFFSFFPLFLVANRIVAKYTLNILKKSEY